ncbi:GPP34 family phosphoprotein [Streptomyces sp. Z26]|uniref:GOLPH3/VPS74 family protein n=1 Tax=Streptomyces TaxID=1883 RepID=UPI000EF13C4C|nr:GPP34 family phosphoprotein [Streptomyces sp. Z26]RLL68874.1 GPP34 family phosphoprotein [Streptomyces sp. Z26]
MTNLTLPEEFMLIALDDDSGRGKTRPGTDYAVAGMALVELSLSGRVEVGDDEVVRVVDKTPMGNSFLDGQLSKIAADGGTAELKDVLKHTRKGVVEGTVNSLVSQGVLKQEKKRVLGLVPVNRYPKGQDGPELAVRKRLDEVVLQGQDPDERTASLIAVLHGARLWKLAFPDADRKQVKKRMEEISEGSWIKPAVAYTVKRTRIAIAAAAAGG